MTTIETGLGPQALAATTPDGPAFADLLANDAVQVAGAAGVKSGGTVDNLLADARFQLATAKRDIERAQLNEDVGQIHAAGSLAYDALDSLYAARDTLNELEGYNLTDAQHAEAVRIANTVEALIPQVQHMSNSAAQDLLGLLLGISAGLSWLWNAIQQ